MIGSMSAEDRLRELELPAQLAGCRLIEGAARTYDLQSRGPLGGRHGTLFRADGDIATLVGIGKIGWLGRRHVNVPIERHVDAFRELGFVEMVLPNGKRYEIRSGWPGVRGTDK
jgi:hypothetical protein